MVNDDITHRTAFRAGFIMPRNRGTRDSDKVIDASKRRLAALGAR
jgi:hypothetical protein